MKKYTRLSEEIEGSDNRDYFWAIITAIIIIFMVAGVLIINHLLGI